MAGIPAVLYAFIYSPFQVLLSALRCKYGCPRYPTDRFAGIGRPDATEYTKRIATIGYGPSRTFQRIAAAFASLLN
jgi:hypothetical protein